MFTRIAWCAAALALVLATAAGQAPVAAARPVTRALATSALRSSLSGAWAGVRSRRACAPARGRQAACLALIRTDVAPHRQPAGRPDAAPTGYGYGPASLQSAYKLPSSTAGGGQTVAVVDAYNDPNAAADLAAYRAAWGLPACGAGCFSVVNQNGQASPLPPNAGGTGWDVEESLDVDMVSAICPNCHIILVEANSSSLSDLGTAVNAAVSLGARYVSNSYGSPEFSSETSYDGYYNHPGVAVTASAGDSGYQVQYPAASQYVTAVGGTTLTTASNARGWSETAWAGTGSGCSGYEAKPSWQHDGGCGHRTNNDVAADADPATGVAVYDTYSQGGWLEVGGTSAASPIIAATFALAGPPATGTYPSSYLYAHPSQLFDVTSGSNGTCSPAYLCTSGAGYDGPTGWGTPDGTADFVYVPPVGPYEVAFQANTGCLWTVGADNHNCWNFGMKAGTSPAITTLTNGQYEAAAQANTGSLWTVGTAGVHNWNLGMAAGTSPAIGALTSGSYEIAFQANTGCLWTVGADNHNCWNFGMKAGTSPAIAGLTNGQYEAAAQANTGSLWTVGTYQVQNWNFGMAAGTSPAITSLAGGGYEVAAQANTGVLWTIGTAGVHNWGLGMKAGTSPAITGLANGGYEVAFQANTGSLWTVGSDNHGTWNLGMAAGTSPAICPQPGNGYEVAFQANTGSLWTVGANNYGPWYLGMMNATSPAITG